MFKNYIFITALLFACLASCTDKQNKLEVTGAKVSSTSKNEIIDSDNSNTSDSDLEISDDLEIKIQELREMCSVVVVKLGGKGSLARVGQEEARADIFKVNAIDTTGAGDSYAAGFLYGYVRDWPLEQTVRLASRVAAQAVSQLGAVVRDRNLLSQIISEISA